MPGMDMAEQPGLVPYRHAAERDAPNDKGLGTAKLIPNYGERWRYGETITTAFGESTINQVVSKRMVKKSTDALESAGRSLAAIDPHSRSPFSMMNFGKYFGDGTQHLHKKMCPKEKRHSSRGFLLSLSLAPIIDENINFSRH